MDDSAGRPLTAGLIADRYEILAELGRGGAAVVYRVRDTFNQREVALKQLSSGARGRHTSELAVLFQREFHTLAQLAHPRIIAVYDFGVEDNGPYYTMEILAGADLRSRAPMPWQDACRLLYDVCSSLALIHARRWVHRDVTPLNIHCTQDGRAKLIDFGALVAMGPSDIGVGTPPFTAPEVIQRALLDARTDLFSVGATLYYVLTGRNAYPARSFAQLPPLWQTPPLPPSTFADLPADLDALVLSLLRPEPLARPASAFDVMQRLGALANIVESDGESVSHAYLTAPNLVAREQASLVIERAIARAIDKHGGSILLSAESGLGRSRLLELCALTAKLRGAVVLRGRPGRSQEFALLEKLLAQLFEILPEQSLSACLSAGADKLITQGEGGTVLKPLAQSELTRLDLHAALVAWLRALCKTQTLVITVDDLEGVDEASVVLLAALSNDAEELGLLVVAALDPSAETPLARAAISALRSRAEPLSLAPMTSEDMFELTRGVFGEVQHLDVVSAALSRLSGGRPRIAMELMQHLVNEGRISYRAGQWTLPAALVEGDLPRSAESALEGQLAQLEALPRRVLELQVLASHDAFTREDYAQVLTDVPPLAVNDALNTLLSAGVLLSEGSVYRIAHRGYVAAIARAIDHAQKPLHHRVLAVLYAHTRGADVLRHWLESGNELEAIEHALSLLKHDVDTQSILFASRMPSSEVSALFVALLEAAERHGLPARGCSDLRRAICAFSTVSDEEHFFRVGPAWLSQLVRDSGLEAYRALDAQLEPGARLTQALRAASQTYLETPETERVYPVPEALRALMHYVIIGIAIGTRTQNSDLLESLPDLLAPFAVSSPIAHALWQNAIATCETGAWAQPDFARERWLEVYKRLSEIQGGDMQQRIDAVRPAVAYGIASTSSYLGVSAAGEWAERVERDPRQRVNALYVRRVIALQRGDADEAESFRRRAEIAALQASTRQMFANSGAELPAHVATHDLAGVRQIIARLAPLAQRFSGWRAYHRCAEGYFELLRGDYEAARRALEDARQIAEPGKTTTGRHLGGFIFASAGLIESLVGLGRHSEARALGREVMAFCEQRKIRAVAFFVARALAAAEAKLEDFASATTRLESVISEQEALGVTGVYLGISYEARARVAIAAGAWDDVEKYAALAAREYRHGKGSLLAGRYERLMDEVRRSQRHAAPVHVSLAQRGSFQDALQIGVVREALERTLAEQPTRAERAAPALSLLCQVSGAARGHLFLSTEGGAVLAASRGGEASDALVRQVQAYLREERASQAHGESVTETVQGLDKRFLIEDVQFSALPLLCAERDQELDWVGVVVLAAAGDSPLAEIEPLLLEAVARKLAQS